MDERVKRVADVVSDHHLIIANIKLKLRSRQGKTWQERNSTWTNLKTPKHEMISTLCSEISLTYLEIWN